jgi:hypothetical protein
MHEASVEFGAIWHALLLALMYARFSADRPANRGMSPGKRANEPNSGSLEGCPGPRKRANEPNSGGGRGLLDPESARTNPTSTGDAGKPGRNGANEPNRSPTTRPTRRVLDIVRTILRE